MLVQYHQIWVVVSVPSYCGDRADFKVCLMGILARIPFGLEWLIVIIVLHNNCVQPLRNFDLCPLKVSL